MKKQSCWILWKQLDWLALAYESLSCLLDSCGTETISLQLKRLFIKSTTNDALIVRDGPQFFRPFESFIFLGHSDTNIGVHFSAIVSKISFLAEAAPSQKGGHLSEKIIPFDLVVPWGLCYKTQLRGTFHLSNSCRTSSSGSIMSFLKWPNF